ncbi:hypothetical protein G4B88_009705 [Cannabis sativa]|uniref:Uncharacterized protein n=1 Tax=Cannabis sativa TaxID=3483 RepID=A0A7J6EGD9_CANSA|nr:hypothetical protein G4B88_009705 [Cannabis sativa]
MGGVKEIQLSIIRVFEPESQDSSSSSSSSKISKGKYAIGFICTLGASAGSGLNLNLTQIFMKKVLKNESFSVIIDVIVFQSLVATIVTLVGLFASSEWSTLREEMNEFQLGKVSYVMTLLWITITWQVYFIGVVGLVLEVSSLFSNVISVLGSPIVPIMAVFFFHENMDGVKAMAMVLAIWGFVSYAYQNYLDNSECFPEVTESCEVETVLPEIKISDLTKVLSIRDEEANEGDSHGYANESNQPNTPQTRKLGLWIRIGFYSFLVLSGQTAATLLGRLYYEKGGKSKWMGSFVQLAGFPILLPYYLFRKMKCKTKNNHNMNTNYTLPLQSKKPSMLVVASVYLILGLIAAAICYLYSVGLMYLPVSTYSIILASQLAFNAFFSFFLNSHKFTPYIINSLVLLTISSILLVLEPGSQKSSKVSKGKYAIGFVCTVAGSAAYGLFLSLMQFFMNKVVKKESFSVIIDVIVYQSLVATVVILVGLFASNEWRSLREEMNEFELGKVSYVMTLSWIAITWQVVSIGLLGLMLQVSSVFSNVISVLGLSIVPIMAVFFFHEKMDGIKAMAMVLAIWGFVSYAYQNHLDNQTQITFPLTYTGREIPSSYIMTTPSDIIESSSQLSTHTTPVSMPLTASPSLRRSSASKLDALYEVSYLSDDGKLRTYGSISLLQPLFVKFCSSIDMEKVEEIQVQLSIRAEEANEGDSHGHVNESNQSTSHQTRKQVFWIRIGFYSFLVLSGQAAATLLGRLYYEKGGKSKWMGSLVQLAGFPILLPYYLFRKKKYKIENNHNTAICYLYSVGLMYLPVSTYSIILASQLAFNAFFSFFLNSHKFTPYIINSLVLLTISSVLLVLEPSSQISSKVSKGKYAIGFVCTVAGSAAYGLGLSLMQYFMNKVLKKESFSVIIDVIVYQSVVATVIILVGLFASSEWSTLREEMNEFQLGKVSYVMTLSWIAITWQVFSIGLLGLILEVSSLFSNVISVLGLPIVPIMAVFLFHEKMNGIKAMSMVMAVWGFVSYAYQNYLDNKICSSFDMGEAQQVKLRIRAEEANEGDSHGFANESNHSTEKFLKKESFSVIRDVIVFQSLVATIAILVGNFTSNELSTLREEMNEFELGKVSYHDMAMSLNMASFLHWSILAFVMLSNSSLQMDSLFLQSPSPILAEEANEGDSHSYANESNQSTSPQTRKLGLWIRIGIYSFLLLSGQATATLLGRLYYEKGGKSKWMGSLVQLVGFPILLPYYLFRKKKIKTENNQNTTTNTNTLPIQSKKPSMLIVASFYLVFGLIIAAICYLYSVGLMYLPVSTYSIILASQLAFNAFFSFFLNSHKFTPYIINSLVLLTISSVLLVLEPGSQKSSKVSKGKYAIGFVCTVGGSAGYGLVLSLTQFFMNKVIKKESFSVIVDVLLFQSLVATVVILVGLFASSEWSTLRIEMNEFELGKVSYVMTLSWTAITWQVFSIGLLGLILEVSSLFSNVIGVLGLPIVPIMAVFFFHEKMNAIKKYLLTKVYVSSPAEEANEGDSHGFANESHHSTSPQTRKVTVWIRIGIYSFLVLFGQAVATLLGRLYYERGGKSKWMATLVQLAGFPIFLPYYIYFIPTKKYKTNHNTTNNTTITHSVQSEKPSTLLVTSIYLVLGLLIAADCYLYSVGLMYLPVSTFSIICASQLAFNAFFSFFLNSQKFTPYIINSLVLLTISSVLLVFEPDSEESSKVSKGKFATGFVCTVGASAGYGLVLSLAQFFMNKVLKKESFSVIVDVIVFQSLVATIAILVGLFASSEWSTLREEMNEFELGKVSYVMTLLWIAITWQIFLIGTVGLILEVSSLFSNVISVLGLPIVPVMAVFFFHEKMDGIKAMAMVLATWGFVSYAYQNYLDSYSSKNENPISNGSPQRVKEINS